jgi:hypothetical protein
VQDYLARADAAGLGWPLASDLTDEALEQAAVSRRSIPAVKAAIIAA